MGLLKRIEQGPERREPNPTIAPLIERRGGTERRNTPRWIEWTREHEERGKSLDSMSPAA